MNALTNNIKVAGFECDDESTVSVIVDDCKFYVQTVDGEYRCDLGCWIMT